MKIPMGPPPPRQPKFRAEFDFPGESSSDNSESNKEIKIISSADGQNNRDADGIAQTDCTASEGSLENGVFEDSGGITDGKPGSDSQSRDAGNKERKEETVSPIQPYSIPPWSEPPGQPYYLEVLKDGSIIERLDVSEKGAYMFGRSDWCDFALEHPTISRFHAVLQYKANGVAYLYDLGSTHGSFVNKNKVQPKVYKQLHVGDVFRFGHSSRLYILQGPTELMPPEHSIKGERQSFHETADDQERDDMEASLLRAKREASVVDGISWGMMEDAFEEDAKENEEEITWQTFKGQLTEKQQKTRDNILKRNEKVANLKKEIDAIQAKEIAQGGLTQGQQTQIARNEQRMEQIVEELENLEDTLNQSIQESIGARIGNVGSTKKKGIADDEDEGQSDDDEFYDRTKKLRNSGQQKPEQQQTVETAETLLEKKEKLAKDMENIRTALQAEEPRKGTENAGGNLESEDPLDAFMTGLSTQIVKDETNQLHRKLESLQSEMNRVVYLLKIADPTGEVSQKRESQVPTQTGQSLSVLAGSSIIRSISSDQKITTKLQKNNDAVGKTSSEKCSASTAMVDDKVPEHEKSTSGSSDNETFTVMKPRWLGAIHNPEEEKVQIQGDLGHPENASDSSEFVGYKDSKRAQHTSRNEDKTSASILENAEGLVLRKPKEVDNKSDTGRENKDASNTAAAVDAEACAADAVALLLRHKRGFAASDEQDQSEKQDSTGGGAHGTQKRKSRKLGPEKPAFLAEASSDYDAWIPPQGQTGDGRTSLNDKYGY
eukprot:Gb_36776 [translate_table: standard]